MRFLLFLAQLAFCLYFDHFTVLYVVSRIIFDKKGTHFFFHSLCCGQSHRFIITFVVVVWIRRSFSYMSVSFVYPFRTQFICMWLCVLFIFRVYFDFSWYFNLLDSIFPMISPLLSPSLSRRNIACFTQMN